MVRQPESENEITYEKGEPEPSEEPERRHHHHNHRQHNRQHQVDQQRMAPPSGDMLPPPTPQDDRMPLPHPEPEPNEELERRHRRHHHRRHHRHHHRHHQDGQQNIVSSSGDMSSKPTQGGHMPALLPHHEMVVQLMPLLKALLNEEYHKTGAADATDESKLETKSKSLASVVSKTNTIYTETLIENNGKNGNCL